MYSKALAGWNPHLKLEYAKMCLRLTVQKIQAEAKRKERWDEDELNEQLDVAVKALTRGNATARENGNLIDFIEELRGQKQALIDEKERKLAEKLGTKWYNEGEKSARYFLRIFSRSMPDKFTSLIRDDGSIVEHEAGIETEILSFYKKLYQDYRKEQLEDSDESFFDNITAVDPSVEEKIAKISV